MIYLDSAALVKLIRREHATPELMEWLNANPDAPLASSTLAEVEVPRALLRVAPEALPAVAATLAQLYRVEMDAEIRADAGSLSDPDVRSLDAIHLATARAMGEELTAFVSYDRRLLRAGEALGLPTISPGA
ncbi:MAG: type II toxin-antitoxin system VapC family toxin [Candidatus Dormibacteria bacterium]